MKFPIEIIEAPLVKRGWRSVYTREAANTLVDLHDAIAAGRELHALKPYLDRLAQATQGKWRFAPALATPILLEFCEAAQAGAEIPMSACLDRLAWCAKKTGDHFVVPIAVYNSLEPAQAEVMRLFGPVRVVA